MIYSKYQISEELEKRVETAVFNMYKTQIEAKTSELVDSFLHKGYTPSEIEVLPKLTPFASDKTLWVQLKVKLMGEIYTSAYVNDAPNSNITAKVSMFEPSIGYTKELNEALIAVKKEYYKWVEQQATEKEKLFRQLIQLPINFSGVCLHSEDHGAYIYSGNLCMHIDGKNIEATEAMQTHYSKLFNEYKTEKAAAEAAKKEAVEAGLTELRTWAEENGSELLRLRIKHGQNWLQLAKQEWAVAHTVNFGLWPYEESVDDYNVKNASLLQLRELETAKAENPMAEIVIMRSKFADEEAEEAYHRTFLRCEVKTPVGECLLYSEIEDISNEE